MSWLVLAHGRPEHSGRQILFLSSNSYHLQAKGKVKGKKFYLTSKFPKDEDEAAQDVGFPPGHVDEGSERGKCLSWPRCGWTGGGGADH